jgi:formylglycine-generating enzyme required for sulfatase activity
MSNNKLIVNTPTNPSKNHAPRIAALFFTLLMSVVCFPVFAQTDSASSIDEKALEQLVEIRDADIAKELARIEESYNRETQDLLRITMQIGNLETANKVKRMLENPDKKAAQYAETTNSTQEKAVVRLMEQREKQIAQATAPTVPIQKWFKESSERLVRKAVQAGDLAVANKLKAMIDQVGGAAGGNKVSGGKNMVVKEVQPGDLAAANKVKVMIDPAGGAAGGNTVSVDKNMVLVEGGTLPKGSGLEGQVVSDFQIGKHEVTWGEWQKVRDWAVANGYDLKDVGQGQSETHPVANVNWYGVVKWCNAKSEKEGKTPVYQVSGTTYKTGETVPTVSESANGYRLPSEKEWEWAARGGKNSKGYTYAGSNDVNAVGWFKKNSKGKTHEVGGKLANELEIYDMSGNVWEWCVDLDGTSGRRSLRGASWMDDPARCLVDCPHSDRPHNWYRNVGFRLARSSGN